MSQMEKQQTLDVDNAADNESPKSPGSFEKGSLLIFASPL
jgi:hypothetical protein